MIGRFPVFIFKGASDLDAFYGMPKFLGLGVKVARHGGTAVNPDEVDRSQSDHATQTVRRFLEDHIPALAQAGITRTEICLYTVAPEINSRLTSFRVAKTCWWQARAAATASSSRA